MDDLLPETGNERQGLILNSDANLARSKLQVFGSFASSTRDAPRNPNRRLPMSAIAARFSGSPMADRWFRGDFRTVRVKSEHVPGESIFVTALTMLKAAKNRHWARSPGDFHQDRRTAEHCDTLSPLRWNPLTRKRPKRPKGVRGLQ
jgi:hypothetical protein